MDARKARRIAQDLIRQHLGDYTNWQFQFDRAKRRFVRCRFHTGRCQFVLPGQSLRHTTGGGVISLSKPLTELNEEEQVRDTLLHEIAHALCGPSVGHSEAWRRVARKLGCRAERCYDHTKVERPLLKYTVACPRCGHESQRNIKTDISCGRCDDKFNPDYRLVYHRNPGVHSAPIPEDDLKAAGADTDFASDSVSENA